MSKKLWIALGLVWLTISACEEESEVFEELNKLRGLGVAINPLIANPSTATSAKTISLTVHAVVPLGETIDVSLFEDEENKLTPNIDNLKIIAGSAHHEDYGALRKYEVKASFVVPTLETLAPIMNEGVVNLRYGFLLSSGGEEEKIVGKVAVMDPSSEEGKKKWENPKFSIEEPGDVISKDTEVTLRGKLSNQNDEQVKIGWFVSGGKVKNRRALETDWETTGDDKQLVIGTVRGKRSHSFAIDIKEINAE